MILGSVNANREAVIEIAVVGDNKRLKSVTAVVDTGFTGDLTLSRVIIAELGLTWRGIQEGILGDGSVEDFDMYVASVIWDGEIRRIEVNAAEMGLLVGMG